MAKQGAVLTDEGVAARIRLVLRGPVDPDGTVRYDLAFELLSDEGTFDRPTLEVTGYREPLSSLQQFERLLRDLVGGGTRAAQHETYEEGFAVMVEAEDQGDRLRVEWWVDLARASRALRLRGGLKGARQMGLRLTVGRASLELFRQALAADLRALLS